MIDDHDHEYDASDFIDVGDSMHENTEEEKHSNHTNHTSKYGPAKPYKHIKAFRNLNQRVYVFPFVEQERWNDGSFPPSAEMRTRNKISRIEPVVMRDVHTLLVRIVERMKPHDAERILNETLVRVA